LVYAASSNRAVNEAVAGEARMLGLPVNVASHAEAGSFITPGILRRGRLTVAVSTSGAGPSAAAQITAQIAGLLGEEYEPYLDFLHELRTEIKRQEPSPAVRSRLLRRLGKLDVLNEMRQGTFIPWTPEVIVSWIAGNRDE
jgi:precorrin-2 dehydrogenase/sirohydrochlorin ferrochelatase